jgi:hypothetical protein
MKKKVGILTTFYRWDESYSLTSVVKDQLIAHVKNGYEPVLFVLESFQDDDKLPAGIELRRVIPQVILEPYAGLNVPDDCQWDVDRVVDALRKYASDIDVMLTHDIIFIDTYLPYNLALRQANLKARYFHWIHSAPSPRPVLENNLHANRYTLPPNSKLVYLNHDKHLALAEMYGTFLNNVRVIPNSRDPRTFWNLNPFVSAMVDKYDLLNRDIISVYPVSTPRMLAGKQVDVVIRIHGWLKKLGYKTLLVITNAHANAQAEKDLIEKCLELGKVHGLYRDDILFTSLEGEEYEAGIPGDAVSDFFRLANVFIFPSISENCSLVLLEAMLSGNLLILNRDCSGLAEFGGPAAIYLKFGNVDMGIRNEEDALKRDSYYNDIAKIIASEFEGNRVLQTKRKVFKEHNYDFVFSKIEALYYEQ